MKLYIKNQWIILEIIFFLVVAILYAIDEKVGTVAFWIWILLLAGIPLCIGEFFNDKKLK
jgi:hypothetical protein